MRVFLITAEDFKFVVCGNYTKAEALEVACLFANAQGYVWCKLKAVQINTPSLFEVA